MKKSLKFLLIAGVILVLSAGLTPLLYKYLPVHFKFERIFNRLIMIFTLAAVIKFVRVDRKSFSKLGLAWDQKSLPFFLRGFLAGLVILAALAAVRLGLGNMTFAFPSLSLTKFTFILIKVMSACLLIGVIEEFFFRGFMFLTLKDKFAWPVLFSLLGTNVFYSLLHFVSDYSPFIGPEPTFWDSWKLVAAPFHSLASWQNIWPGAIGLFIFGLVLNTVFIRVGSLYGAIGLHAGCVFFLKWDGYFLQASGLHTRWFGTHQMYDGVLGWAFLLILWGIVLQLFPNEKVHHATAKS